MHCVLHGVQCSGPPPSAWAAGTSRGAKDSVVSFSHLYQSSEMETEEVGSRCGWEVSGDTNSLSEKVTFDQRPRSSKGAICVCVPRGGPGIQAAGTASEVRAVYPPAGRWALRSPLRVDAHGVGVPDRA